MEDHKPLRNAKEWADEGRVAYQKGNFSAAAHAFQAAAGAYQESGDALLEAEMANDCSVAWLQAGDPIQALTVLEGTDAEFAGAGDTKRQAMAGNRAAALDGLRRYDEALDLYRQSAQLLEQVGESELRAYVLQAISKIQFRTGKQFEALASMQAAIEGIQRPNLRQRFLKHLLRLPMRWLGFR
jgi:tetratricopeptide (TPR) repeat protein